MNKKKEEQQAANEAENKSALESESWVGILKAGVFVLGFFFFLMFEVRKKSIKPVKCY